MRMILFLNRFFALIMTMSGLLLGAAQLTTVVKSAILPVGMVETFIRTFHSCTHAIVSISSQVKDQYSIPESFADLYITNRFPNSQSDSEGHYSIFGISIGSTVTFAHG